MVFRRKNRAILPTLIGLMAWSLGGAEICVIDAGKSQGTWDGWGTSLCWFANVFGERDDIADALFTMRSVKLGDEVVPGLGLNIVRYNAGACSSNSVGGQRIVLSHSIPKWKQMEGFWRDPRSEDPQSESWDWTVDVRQRAMLQKARDRGVNYFELFSNSPMWWMCQNRNPSGAAKATNDNLSPENYEKFAVYLATISKYARDNWGVPFRTVEPFNEPISDYWSANGRQEGCHFSPVVQAAVLKHLRAQLDKRDLSGVAIAASDESKYDWAVETWRNLDDATKALVSQVNVHGYQYAEGPRTELFKIVGGKRIWNSEYGDAHADGLELSRNLHLDFRFLRPTAWNYWQPLDGGNGGAWGLFPADLRRGVISGKANPKYYVLAQYTRHIRPGMSILTTGETETVAAFDPKEGKLVIAVQNLTNTVREKTYDLSKIGLPDGEVRHWMTEPNGASRYYESKATKVENQRLVVSLPPFSIHTFEIKRGAGEF